MCKHEEIGDGIFYGEGVYYRIELVHIDEIKLFDLIIREWDGKICAVCKNDIKYDSFMGTSLFGDCYHSGHKKVKKVFIMTKNKYGKFCDARRV